ncbi:MAG TPA: YceI family protein [Candidatus Limnocylindrales bacterium]
MTTWNIDSAHSSVGFSVKHMMVATVRGDFTGVEGVIHFDEAEPTRSSVQVRIPTESVNTGMAVRDEHLRSADFLDAKQFPFLTFKSATIAAAGDAFKIGGDLTIRDVTRPVVLDATIDGIAPGMKGDRLAGFEAHTKIRRADWGLTWNKALEAGGMVVGDEVSIVLDLEATEIAGAGKTT